MPAFLARLTGANPPLGSDRALLEQFATENDQSAFAAVVDRHGPLVLGVCRRLLGDTHLANEAFQATFLALARKSASMRYSVMLSSWLFGTARRVALTTRGSTPKDSQAIAVAEPGGLSQDHLSLLDEELERLPDRYRAPVLACSLRGLTHDEAARDLGCDATALRRNLERGQARLRSRLALRDAGLDCRLLAGTALPEMMADVPPELRQRTIDAAGGGPVSPAVRSLVLSAKSSHVIPAMAVTAGAVVLAGGLAWVLFAPPNSADQPDPSPPRGAPGKLRLPGGDPPARVVRISNPWVEPFPTGAVARLGTTAFRHGTGGPGGFVEPFGVWQLAFRPDGLLISAGGECVRFWNPESGRDLTATGPVISTRWHWLIRSQLFGGGRFYALPDTNEVGESRSTMTVWDLDSRTKHRSIPLAVHSGRKSMVLGPSAVSADGTRYVEIDPNGDTWIWDGDGQPRSKLVEKLSQSTAIFLTPDGKSVVTADGAHRVRMWDAASGAKTREFRPDLSSHTVRVTASALSPDGRWLATFCEFEYGDDHAQGRVPEAIVRLWDLSDGKENRVLAWGGVGGRSFSRTKLAFDADSRALGAVRADGREILRLAWWPIPDGTPMAWRAEARGLAPVSIAIDPRRSWIAVGGQGVIRLFDVSAGQELMPADAHAAAITRIEFDKVSVRTDDAAGERRRWNSTSGELMAVESATARANRPFAVEDDHLTVDPDGPSPKRIATSVYAEFVRRDMLKCADVAADGSAVAIGLAVMPPTPTEFGRVGVIDLATGKVRWQVAMAESAPATLRFSPDGSLVAVGTTQVRVFNAQTGDVVATFKGHRGAVTALTFTADGRRLASGSTDTTAIVWRISE